MYWYKIIYLKKMLLGDAINHNIFKNYNSFNGLSQSFWCGFGIFFPAVSGFLAGTNKSGELKVILLFNTYNHLNI